MSYTSLGPYGQAENLAQMDLLTPSRLAHAHMDLPARSTPDRSQLPGNRDRSMEYIFKNSIKGMYVTLPRADRGRLSVLSKILSADLVTKRPNNSPFSSR